MGHNIGKQEVLSYLSTLLSITKGDYLYCIDSRLLNKLLTFKSYYSV